MINYHNSGHYGLSLSLWLILKIALNVIYQAYFSGVSIPKMIKQIKRVSVWMSLLTNVVFGRFIPYFQHKPHVSGLLCVFIHSVVVFIGSVYVLLGYIFVRLFFFHCLSKLCIFRKNKPTLPSLTMLWSQLHFTNYWTGQTLSLFQIIQMRER